MKNYKDHVGKIAKKVYEETQSWLRETFVNDLEKLGFEYLNYGYTGNDTNGVHILFFNEDPQRPGVMTEGREEDYKKMVEIGTQDDDSQPHATHRYYCGSLWVFIPFVA